MSRHDRCFSHNQDISDLIPTDPSNYYVPNSEKSLFNDPKIIRKNTKPYHVKDFDMQYVFDGSYGRQVEFDENNPYCHAGYIQCYKEAVLAYFEATQHLLTPQFQAFSSYAENAEYTNYFCEKHLDDTMFGQQVIFDPINPYCHAGYIQCIYDINNPSPEKPPFTVIPIPEPIIEEEEEETEESINDSMKENEAFIKNDTIDPPTYDITIESKPIAKDKTEIEVKEEKKEEPRKPKKPPISKAIPVKPRPVDEISFSGDLKIPKRISNFTISSKLYGKIIFMHPVHSTKLEKLINNLIFNEKRIAFQSFDLASIASFCPIQVELIDFWPLDNYFRKKLSNPKAAEPFLERIKATIDKYNLKNSEYNYQTGTWKFVLNELSSAPIELP